MVTECPMVECQIMMHTLTLLRTRVRCVCMNDLHAMHTKVEVRDILTVIFVLVCLVCLFHDKNTDTCIIKLQSSLAKQSKCKSNMIDTSFFADIICKIDNKLWKSIA